MPTTTGGSECSAEGEIRFHFNHTSDGLVSHFEGDFEICIRGFYGSVCDIGWNQAAAHAQALCHNQFDSSYGKLLNYIVRNCSFTRYFVHTVAEPLYRLGTPRWRYLAQYLNCSDSAFGLRNCNYETSVGSECYSGPHVAGVRCTES